MTIQVLRAKCGDCGIKVRLTATGQYDHHRRHRGGRLTERCPGSWKDVPKGVETEPGPQQPTDYLVPRPGVVAPSEGESGGRA